jgi:hypothetical protein
MSWKLKVYYWINKNPTLSHMLNQVKPVHTLASNFLKIFKILSSHLHWFFQVFSFLQISPPIHCMYLPCITYVPHGLSIYSSWFDHKMYKLWITMLCSLLLFPVNVFLIRPNIFLSTLFHNTLRLCSSLSVKNQVLHPYNATGQNYTFVYFTVCFWITNEKKTKVSGLNGSRDSLNSLCS